MEYQAGKAFDVVRAQYIFHIFQGRTDISLVALLQRLRTQVLVLETHRPDEDQMRGVYRNFAPEAFVRFVGEHTGLDNWHRLGEVEEGRSVYVLSSGS